MASPVTVPGVVAPRRPLDPPVPSRPVRVRALSALLLGVSAALVVVNLVVKVLADPARDMGAWIVAFDVNRETNVPTVWNALLLLAVAAGCVLVAALTPPSVRLGRARWLLAALVAVALCFDELLRWHERLRVVGAALAGALPAAVPTYTWVLPGILVATAGTVVLVLGARRLPRDVRRLLLLGAAAFLGGALGLEAASGWVEARSGLGVAYTLVTAGEEALEMTGCVVALVAVLRMLRSTVVDGRPAFVLRADA